MLIELAASCCLSPRLGDLMQLVMQKIMHKPPPLSSLRSDIPADVERAVMRALEIDPQKRPASVAAWIEELEQAAEDVDEAKKAGISRLVILAPIGAEVYVEDERKGSVGRSGRVVLTDTPVGQHILRVSKPGEKDDERVIEIQAGGNEQVIQAQLRTIRGTTSQPSPSQESGSGASDSSMLPGIVACSNCNSRFAEGVKFCGRCGSGSFILVSPGDVAHSFPCPRCSVPLPMDSKFCGRCGFNISPAISFSTARQVGFVTGAGEMPTQAERICRRCSSSFPPHIKFCGKCGGSLF